MKTTSWLSNNTKEIFSDFEKRKKHHKLRRSMSVTTVVLLMTFGTFFAMGTVILSVTPEFTGGKKALTGVVDETMVVKSPTPHNDKYDRHDINFSHTNSSISLTDFTEPKMVYVEGITPLYTVTVLQAPIPAARSQFKSWMDWRSITYRNSRQWRMQQIAYTCEIGFRRVDGLYMIALGTYFLYQGVGDVFDITLSSGITFRGIVGDIKSDRHTDPTNRFHVSDGSVVEFIVDRQVMCRYALFTRGDISFAGFPGEVVLIERIPELFIAV